MNYSNNLLGNKILPTRFDTACTSEARGTYHHMKYSVGDGSGRQQKNKQKTKITEKMSFIQTLTAKQHKLTKLRCDDKLYTIRRV